MMSKLILLLFSVMLGYAGMARAQAVTAADLAPFFEYDFESDSLFHPEPMATAEELQDLANFTNLLLMLVNNYMEFGEIRLKHPEVEAHIYSGYFLKARRFFKTDRFTKQSFIRNLSPNKIWLRTHRVWDRIFEKEKRVLLSRVFPHLVQLLFAADPKLRSLVAVMRTASHFNGDPQGALKEMQIGNKEYLKMVFSVIGQNVFNRKDLPVRFDIAIALLDLQFYARGPMFLSCETQVGRPKRGPEPN